MVVDFSLNMLNRRDGIFKLLRNREGFSQTVLARPLLYGRDNGEKLAEGHEQSDTSTSTKLLRRMT